MKADKNSLKEWDYYVIVDSDGYAFSMTVADNRYMGLANSNFYDFANNKKYAYITPLFLPDGQA